MDRDTFCSILAALYCGEDVLVVCCDEEAAVRWAVAFEKEYRHYDVFEYHSVNRIGKTTFEYPNKRTRARFISRTNTVAITGFRGKEVWL